MHELAIFLIGFGAGWFIGAAERITARVAGWWRR